MEASVNQVRTEPASQPWLSSSAWDCLFIISPAFITSLIALALRPYLEGAQSIPLWAFVCFVLCVDVAHVYSTLFRTYLDKEAFQKNKPLLLAIPATCWGLGSMLYSLDWQLFWRVLAYLAVFHFVRQQYGFMALYSRRDPLDFLKVRWLDHLAIYMATIYPLLFWHTHLPRNFNWFVEGDFVESVPAFVTEAALALYLLIAVCYVAKELILLKLTGFINIPKNLILAGTAFSWWVGIVALNSDIAFTMTNVVTHGVPYMALIWLYNRKPAGSDGRTHGKEKFRLSTATFRQLAMSSAPAFVCFLVLLAYLEEGLWDGLIWREHLSFFGPFVHLPSIADPALLSILIPLLALPQSTHYLLDGFIWRVKDRSSIWST